MSRQWMPNLPYGIGTSRIPPVSEDNTDTTRVSSLNRFRYSEPAHAPSNNLQHPNSPTSCLDDGLDDFEPIEQHPEYLDALNRLSKHTGPHQAMPRNNHPPSNSSPSLRASERKQQYNPAFKAVAPRLPSTHSPARMASPLMNTQIIPASSAYQALHSTLPPESSPALPTRDAPTAEYSQPKPSPSATGPPRINGIQLISLRKELPDSFRAVFPYELLNAVQSKCFEVVYHTNDNVVVAAPTGSGKTTILELAICKLALERGNQNFKIVYQAPTKALCSEKARDWEKKFKHINLRCAELTGDTSQAEMRRVGDASIIVTTPEKWDSITRKWQDHRRLLQMVELFLIDEVHILKDVRGATLEAVVSRMKTIGSNVRFVALSATVPNSDDIAQWLGRNHTTQHLPAYRETFGEEFRPVKLQKFVYGFECGGNEFIFDKYLDQKLPGLISRHSQQKPILVFCFTRKSCETTANLLADYAANNGKQWPMPSKRIPVIGRDLQEIVQLGVAFHHAGLDAQDRNAVEQSFLKGELGVICCTSTLAVGINLPCHTVVLKGTVGYMDDTLQEYSDLEVMQMLGRAGRPQFDDNATAIIVTRKENKGRYEKMASGQEILESTLHLNLIEHLNSEVCLGTIHDITSAKVWLGGTFLSVRLRRNPKYYQLIGDSSNPNPIDDQLESICERDIRQLQEAQLMTDGESFKSTDYGRAMSKYMVEFATMKMILQMPRGVKMDTLIVILAQAAEFKEFRFKPAERAVFREINKDPLIVYPIKETVTQTWHKISLIVQAQLGCVQVPDSGDGNKLRRQLVIEQKLVFERLNRLVRAVVDCKGHDGDAIGMKNALELSRALSAGAWDGRATQLTQIPNIGPAGMRKLSGKGIRTVLELASKYPDEIEGAMSRKHPFGSTILASLEKFPHLGLDLTMVGHRSHLRGEEPRVDVEVKATLRFFNRKGVPDWKKKTPGITFLAETSDGALCYFWRGSIRKLDKELGFEVRFTAELHHAEEQILCHFSCEEIVGTIVSKVLHHGIPVSAFPAQPKIPKHTPISRPQVVKEEEFLDDDDIDDSDLLLAAEDAEQAAASSHVIAAKSTSRAQPPASEAFDEDMDAGELDDDDCPSIEELIEQSQSFPEDMEYTSDATHDPVQLPNGRWQCNHICTGGTLTKTGKPCNHKCCKEGLDKPRKRVAQKPKPKRKAEDAIDGVDSHLEICDRAAKRQKPKDKEMSSYFQPESATRQRGQSAGTNWEAAGFDDFDLECIDLSYETDDGAEAQISRSGKGSHAGGAADMERGLLPSSSASVDLGFGSTQVEAGLDDRVSSPYTGRPMHSGIGHAGSKGPFRRGAKDEVLYQAKDIDSHCLRISDDDAPSSSGLSVSQEPASEPAPATSPAMLNRLLDDATGEQENAPVQDGIPDWVSDIDYNQQIMDVLGPYVNFVL
ncbi:putative ATP-dependent DNA helicase, partial [Podospora australis]